MVRTSLIYFILFAAVEFFLLSFIPKELILLAIFATVIFLVLAVILWSIYERKIGFKRNFNFEIILFLLSTVSAMLGAKYGHGQNVFLTAWVQSYMYFYFFYFFLHLIKFRPQELEKAVIVIAVIFLIVYFAQYILYPTLITGARVGSERGTVRIFLPGDGIAMLVFFYFLQKLLQSNNFRYAIYCLFYLMVPVLQGTRNAIATLLFGSLIYILFSNRVRSRLGVVFLTSMAAVLFFFVFQNIIVSLIEVTTDQVGQEEDDIRERSATFYLTEFYPNKLNYILGNGTGHMRSRFGMNINYYKTKFGFYQSDLGILHGYLKYGILFLLAKILVIRKIFVIKIQPRYTYIKYWAVVLIIRSILGSPFLTPGEIVAILVVLYLIDVSNYELNSPKELNEA